MYLEKIKSATSVSTLADTECQQFISQPPPVHLHLAYSVSVWFFKTYFAVVLRAGRLFPKWRPGLLQPEVRAYPIRPDLKNRIFRPDGCRQARLPLYIDVHGGGWAVADPETDDEFCSFLVENFGIIVVSIDYHKSPSYRFPHAVTDIAAITDAVLRDESLNIDKGKVVLGGFSAGGNLAFAASQTGILQGRVNGLVGLYPCLDLSEPIEEKLRRRPKNSGSDLLASSANFLDWAYVPIGTDRRNPLLSPIFAQPEDLPPCVYLIGAEYDMLCHESERMAESLAVKQERFARTSIPALATEDGWQQGSVRWECVRGRKHAFTHIAHHGRKEIDRVKACHEMYYRIGLWLTEECRGAGANA
jgi:acetyl esterase/lipase